MKKDDFICAMLKMTPKCTRILSVTRFYRKGKSTMAKKIFKTMDGNEAAAYIAYAFTELASIFPIRRRRRWLNTSMNGLLMAVRTCLARPSRFRKCS